jgi:uncharacterized protein (TIGR03067 family)
MERAVCVCMALVCLLPAGCGTFGNVWLMHEEGGERIFGGVRLDGILIRDAWTSSESDKDIETDNPPTLHTAQALLDMPFSAVGDLVTLPYTISLAMKRAKQSASASDPEVALDGSWRLVSKIEPAEKGLSALRVPMYYAEKLVVSKGRFTWMSDGGSFSTASFVVNKRKRPWTIDFVTDVKLAVASGPIVAVQPERLRGICKLEGDTLTFCMELDEDDRRPSEFVSSTRRGTRYLLRVYRRERPAESPRTEADAAATGVLASAR